MKKGGKLLKHAGLHMRLDTRNDVFLQGWDFFSQVYGSLGMNPQPLGCLAWLQLEAFGRL